LGGSVVGGTMMPADPETVALDVSEERMLVRPVSPGRCCRPRENAARSIGSKVERRLAGLTDDIGIQNYQIASWREIDGVPEARSALGTEIMVTV